MPMCRINLNLLYKIGNNYPFALERLIYVSRNLELHNFKT